jgi:cell shape-determining protein MreD
MVWGLAVAVALGYVEDLHQGAPVGVLSLAFALAFLVLHWAAGRIAVRGWTMRALVSLMAVALIDIITITTLFVLADPLAIRTEALWPMLLGLRWHALATLLVAPPVWALLQRVFTMFRLDAQAPSELHLS